MHYNQFHGKKLIEARQKLPIRIVLPSCQFFVTEFSFRQVFLVTILPPTVPGGAVDPPPGSAAPGPWTPGSPTPPSAAGSFAALPPAQISAVS
jgi:hypothetical protein